MYETLLRTGVKLWYQLPNIAPDVSSGRIICTSDVASLDISIVPFDEVSFFYLNNRSGRSQSPPCNVLNMFVNGANRMRKWHTIIEELKWVP